MLSKFNFYPLRYIYRMLFLKALKYLYFRVYKTEERLLTTLNDNDGEFNSSLITYKRYEVKNSKLIDYINRVNIKTHKDYLEYIRFKNIEWALLHSPATTASLIVSILSLVIPIFLVFNAQLDIWLLLQLIFGIFLSIVFFFALVPYLKHYVRQLPLNDYAFFIRNVYTESEMISFISYRIWATCNKFKANSDWLATEYKFYENEDILVKHFLVSEEEILPNLLKKGKEYFPDLRKGETYFRNPSNDYGINRLRHIKENFGEGYGKDYKLKENIKHKISSLNFTINELEKDLQQISELMKYCAERLRIPEVELAEHLFQFSTSMYWSWIKKVSHNLDVVRDLLYHADFPGAGLHYVSSDILYDQIKAMLYQIDRFLKRNERFMHYQCQNIAFNDLHDDVIAIGSSSSSSEPIKIYIRLLSRVHSERDTSKSPAELSKTSIERLVYLFHKRKIHIGLDLHYSANRVLQKIIVSITPPAISTLPSGANFSDLATIFERKKFQTFLKDVQNKKSVNISKLNNLEFLHSSSVIYIDDCRNKMEIAFDKKTGELFKEWIGEIIKENYTPKEKIFIITFGYSKAVRQVIKNCIIGSEIEKYSRLIVFSSETESKIASRKIKYHLTEQPEKRAHNVLVSNPDFIIPLIDKESKIIALMGAEVFDEAKNTVRTHAYKECLIRFLKGAICKMSDPASYISGSDCITGKHFIENEDVRKNIKVFVCAESYKEYKTLTELVDLFDDQYENIEIYDSSLITDVIHD